MTEAYILDQVRNNTLVWSKLDWENNYIVVTRELLMLPSILVVKLSELELVDLQNEANSVALVRHLTVADNKGHFFKRRACLSEEAAVQIKRAISQAAPHIVIGYTPDNQIAYKKRHMQEIEYNLRASIQARYNGNAYTSGPVREEILFSSTDINSSTGICVTESKLVVKKCLTVAREDVEWFFMYAVKHYEIVNVLLRDGRLCRYRIYPSQLGRAYDFRVMETLVGALLPNAATGYSDISCKWWALRHGNVPSLTIM